VIDVGHERDRHGDRQEQGDGAENRALVVPAVAPLVGQLDRLENAVGLTVIEQERSPTQLAGVRLTGPGHRDHERDREHPGRQPDPSGQQDAER